MIQIRLKNGCYVTYTGKIHIQLVLDDNMISVSASGSTRGYGSFPVWRHDIHDLFMTYDVDTIRGLDDSRRTETASGTILY